MIKGVLVLILGLIFVTSAWGEQTAQFYLNPYYPQYQQESSTALLDASLQKDLVKFAERRDHLQQILGQTPQDPTIIEKDTTVLKRILDRTSARLLKSDFIRSSFVGKTANTVKDKMETNVEIKDAKNISHRFDFRLAVFQGQAFIQYSGFTKAQLRYDYAHGGRLAMIFQHTLSPSSSIGIESSLAGSNQVQMVNLQYVW